MKLEEASRSFSINKSTYINLRWIVYLGQIITILLVEFYFKFSFNYIFCLIIVFLSAISNLYLQFRITSNQLSNLISSYYLAFDILQLGCLLYLTGGITNPFIILLIIPAVFSGQYLSTLSSIILVTITTLVLFFLTFFYLVLPSPESLHFHVPDFYLYSIPTAIFIGLIFLSYFVIKFRIENSIRDKAFNKLQEIMAKENELLSLGGQAAAAAHSLGTPLSTIFLIAKELRKEFLDNKKIIKDIDLLVSQSERCNQILKKLSLNPKINDGFIDSNLSLSEYIKEIVRSYREISKKEFVVNLSDFKKRFIIKKSVEILYGLRNFIGNANKFSENKIEIFLKSNEKFTEIIIRDDGPGFPKDLIDKHRLGEPYIRTADNAYFSKYGLGLGTFIGKTLLERNFASIKFSNSNLTGGAEVLIKWENKNLFNI
tara:strand:- start:3691 stop:4977 length:1287 start_codon:yes stop_codon:yes gene_type:complete